ncbi:hypothetical protein M9H77_34185 [Catharanthus roseus]|uniref:Uncharacterized protein n=1 Tax=Catharanthus roseus TaxID=4058 RepID=A0ACB9ZL76_CATRO|nr:hypothetical protein M9H77_34185 [Catharanthus roseus]
MSIFLQMKTRLLFKFLPAKARTSAAAKRSLYIVTAATVGFLSLNDYNHLFSTSPFSHATEFPLLYAVVRCSRALFTISLNVADYKYSLHGLSAQSDEYRNVLSQVHLRSAKRILKLCETNRGFYVKAGQFAAAIRQVPKEYSSTLSSLQDQSAPCQFNVIKDLLVNSLGQELSEIFISFDEQPIAAASIAQVHHAVLKDHQRVAVKVQYPGLEDQMKFDLATMSFLSNSVAWFFPEYRFGWLVSEFGKSISSELDFIQEAKNSQRVATNFQHSRKVRVPHVFWDLTTTQVLTMEFCKGQKVDDLKYLEQVGIDPIKVAKALTEVVAEMVFIHGFLHGDLHPGNILVSAKGQNDFSLVLLDFGICRELDESFRLNYCKLWKALIFMNSRKIEQLSEQMGVGKYSRYFPVLFMGRPLDSKTAIGKEMSVEEKNILKQELKSLKMDLSTVMESLPPDFLTVLRTDGLLVSLISKLGAPRKVRMQSYAKYALYGISTEKKSDSTIKSVICKFETGIQIFQIRLLFDILQFLALLEDYKVSFTKRFRELVISAGSVVRNSFLQFL